MRFGKWLKSKLGEWKYRIAIAVLAICVLSYTVFHLISLFGEEMSTFAAGVTTETESLSGTGYVFRDETVLYSSNGGVVDYLCENGTKVTKGQKLAEVYSTGTSGDRDLVERIDRQIAVLEKSSDASVTTIDIAKLQKEINDDYYMLVRMLASGQTGEMPSQIDNMLVGMDKLSVMTDEDSAVTQTLESLRLRKEQLISEAGSCVTETSHDSGYFYTSADGYEQTFTMDALDSLTVSSFESLITEKRTLSTSYGIAYGKLAETSKWGFVLEIPARESDFFEPDTTYSLEFTENGGIELPMTLMRKLDAPERSSVLLVFSCDRLPENFVYSRVQSVRIELSSVSGIYVPKRAVKTVDGMEGVYILRGSVVHFRHIYIIYEGSDYYLVSEDGAEDDFIYLAPNDLIILNGQNLFEGRILD